MTTYAKNEPLHTGPCPTCGDPDMKTFQNSAGNLYTRCPQCRNDQRLGTAVQTAMFLALPEEVQGVIPMPPHVKLPTGQPVNPAPPTGHQPPPAEPENTPPPAPENPPEPSPDQASSDSGKSGLAGLLLFLGGLAAVILI